MLLSEEASRFWSITKTLRSGQTVSPDTKRDLSDLIQTTQHKQIRDRINQLANPTPDPTPGSLVALQKGKVRRQSP